MTGLAPTRQDVPVADLRAERGKAIRERLDALGMSRREFSQRKGVPDRSVVTKAIEGDDSVRASTYGKIEAALDRLWSEMGMDDPDTGAAHGSGLVEFEVSGDFGVRVVVKGPVADRAELEESVLHLIRQMRANGGGDTPAG